MKPNPNILVVDDDTSVGVAVSLILKRKGFKTEVAGNGTTALKLAGASPFDLILLDIDLPDMDGFHVCRCLKQNKALAHIPVLFCSGRADPSRIEEAFAAGGAGFLSKPFTVDELSDYVCKLYTCPTPAGRTPPPCNSAIPSKACPNRL